MVQLDEITWKADEGKVFIRKFDNFIMGDCIQLGLNNLTKEPDTIENYEEIIDEEHTSKENYEEIIDEEHTSKE